MSHSHEQVQKDINSLISQFLNDKLKKSTAIHEDFNFFWQSILDLHKAGGKRLRPYILVLAYEAFGGGNYETILPIAASVELLHSAMLIHDDVMDRDYLRHGKTNIAGMYQKRYAKLKNKSDIDHYANSAAIMAGDLLLSESYQSILGSKIGDEDKIRIMKLLGEAVSTTIGGQLLDSEAVIFPEGNTDSLITAIHKTSYYTFNLPLLIGSMLAGANDGSIKNLISIGTSLGIAFQLSDDLQGIFGNSSHTGKPDFGDIREGKQTYLLQTANRIANQKQKNLLKTIIGNPNCDQKMSQKVQQLMTEMGAKKHVEQKIKKLKKDALKLIEKLPVDSKHMIVIKRLVNI